MKKRVLAVIMGMSMMAAAFAGCGSAGNDSATGKSDAASGSKDEKVYTIGISQFAEHGSLDNCREGFIQGLKEEGFEEGKNLVIKINNADADTGTASQIADGFVSDNCLLYTSPSPRDRQKSRMPSSA